MVLFIFVGWMLTTTFFAFYSDAAASVEQGMEDSTDLQT
jgi:hypothetical protein